MVRLQAGDVVADDATNRGRRYLADVADERLGDGMADQAEQGDQDEQAWEDRLDAEIGQRRRPVLQVIVLVLAQRSLGRVTPGAAAQVRRVIWCILGASLPAFVIWPSAMTLLRVVARLVPGVPPTRPGFRATRQAGCPGQCPASLRPSGAPIVVTGGCLVTVPRAAWAWS